MRRKTIIEEIQRQREMMGLITEAGGENPVTLIRRVIQSAKEVGDNDITKYFGKEAAEDLERLGIKNLDELDLKLTNGVRDLPVGFEPRMLGRGGVVDALIPNLVKDVSRRIFTDPSMGWVAKRIVGDYFGQFGNKQLSAFGDVIMKLDLTNPNVIGRSDVQEYLKKAKNAFEQVLGPEEDFTKWFNNYYAKQLEDGSFVGPDKTGLKLDPPTKTDLVTTTPKTGEEPITPKTGEEPITPKTDDESTVTIKSDEETENIVEELSQNEIVKGEISKMDDVELKYTATQKYNVLKNKDVGKWSIEDWSWFTQLSEKGVFTQKQLTEMSQSMPSFSQTKELTKQWSEFKNSQTYKTQIKSGNVKISTFEEFCRSRGYKPPTFINKLGGQFVNSMENLSVNWKNVIFPPSNLTAKQYISSFLKVCMHMAVVFGGIGLAIYKLSEKGVKSGINYITSFTDIPKEDIKNAVNDFFKYDSPEINNINIYGPKDGDVNKSLKENPPTLLQILSIDAGTVQLTKPVSVDGKLYDSFKLQLSESALFKGSERFSPHKMFTIGQGGSVVSPTSNYDKGLPGFKKFIKDKYNQDFTNPIENGNMYYQDQDAKDIGKGWEFIPDTQGSTKGTYQSKTN